MTTRHKPTALQEILQKIEKEQTENPVVEELEDYIPVKVTQHEHTVELHDKLVQTVIDYMKEHNLTDIDTVSFYADSLQTSMEHGSWHPATDSSLTLKGIAYEKRRRKNGKIDTYPYLYEIDKSY